MKPAELKVLVGRHVECYWNGLRTGKVVGTPATDMLTVQFLAPHGRRRIPLEHVKGVFWYKRLKTVSEFIALMETRS